VIAHAAVLLQHGGEDVTADAGAAGGGYRDGGLAGLLTHGLGGVITLVPTAPEPVTAPADGTPRIPDPAPAPAYEPPRKGSSMDPLPALGGERPPADTDSPAWPSPAALPTRPALRVLVTGVPIPGHVMPLLPLAHAIVSAGDQVTLAVAASMAQFAGGLEVLPTGPDIATLLAENDRRTGGADLADLRDIAPLAQFFAATRPDMMFDEALRHARRVDPDVIVADEYDTIAPMLAATLAVPLVQHAIGLPVSPPALVPAMETLLLPRYRRYGLVRAARLALVDPWPEALQEPDRPLAPDRLAIRPRPYTGAVPAGLPLLPAAGGGPRVLVTLGTVLLDGGLLDALVNAVAALDGVDVVALVPPGVPHPLTDPRANVHWLGFTPMADILAAGISAVVAAGGAGTVLAAVSRGIPMVLLPKGAEKPQNAERVVAAGAGIAITDAVHAGDAVHTVLTDPWYRDGAEQIAEQIAGMPDASAVWAALQERLAT
jgi:UDP:flavonoid glycosyltransferase YjiC (YdhE family)